MGDDRGTNRGKGSRNPYRAIGMLTTIPFMMGVAPLVGWWLGRWVDRRIGTEWAFQALGVAVGIGAAIRETVLIIRRAQRDL